MKVIVLIPAGGSGNRFNSPVKKQFLQLGGKSILQKSIQAFLSLSNISQVIVALPASDLDQPELSNQSRLLLTEGGKTRAESVFKAFQQAQADSDDIILVHDAVRPLLTPDLVARVIDSVMQRGSTVPVMPVTDTIKEICDSQVVKTIDRAILGSVQTPQGFRVGDLQKAYDKLGVDDPAITDEAVLIEKAGFPVYTVEGEAANIKVTRPFDLKMAELLDKEKQ